MTQIPISFHSDTVSEATTLRTMSWFLIILFLSLTYFSVSDASHYGKKLSSAFVVGTVYCDTCSQQEFSLGSHFISGASVAVECKYGNPIPFFKKEVMTNEHGEFKVQLPFKVRKYVRRIKSCTFKLISSSEPHCAVASDSTSSSMSLKTRKQGEHIFSAGLFSFKPMEKPNFCNQKQSVPNSKNHAFVKNEFPTTSTYPSTTQVLKHNPTKSLEKSQSDKNLAEDFFFPPNPFLPPPIIPNPFQPPPIIPNPFQPPPLIPNPFQPPKPPFIPNPFQPPSPPPLIPNPFQPPPSSSPLFPNPFQPPPSPTPTPLFPNPFQPPPSPTPTPLFPNPFQPPPSPTPTPLFPNPFQPPPSPTPTPLFPNPFQPPSSSPPSLFPPFPLIPGLTPSPPPPPPPAPTFPFPLPPLFPPLYPTPHIPGTPPASSKNNSP
ncbi:hypothetical protein VNO78_33738 [Psophocarpus tetragonolobus]|uniref:Uncharacterized protein n=1 Tax=Psophocarpus tetragonolobus TaxID=3891 RepID=A0AAN9NYQ7_PSOTE